MQALQADIQVKVNAAARIFARTHADLNDPLSKELSPLNHIREDLLSFSEKPITHETLLHHRDEVIGAIQGYYRLARYFGVVYEWVFNNSVLHKAHNTRGGSIAPVTFYNLHLDFLLKTKEENGLDIEPLIDEFVPCIPLRMTGAAYADYLRSTLNMIFDIAGISAIGAFLQDREALQMLITPGSQELPSCCAVLKEEMDEIWQTDFTEHDLEYNLEYLSKFAPIEERLQNFLAMLFTLLDGVDSVSIVVKYGNEQDMEELRSWVGKSVEELDQAVLEAMQAMAKLDIAENVDINQVEPDNPIVQEWTALTTLFNATGMDYFHLPGAGTHDKILDDLDGTLRAEAINDLISRAIKQAEECVVGLSSRRKRFVRQYIMRGLPFPAKDDILKDYKSYFIETYTALDEFNKLVMINRAEYFQMTVAERYQKA